METIIDSWRNCYPSRWSGLIVPDAIVHPAKFSSRLIRRIYEHMAAEGWLHGGDTVVDPFGGVALGAFDAMRLGLNWIGVELETRFVDLGNGYDCPGFTKGDWKRFQNRFARLNYHLFHLCPECSKKINPGKSRNIPFQEAHRFIGNIDLWEQKYHWWTGSARLVQGDSRNLAQVIGAAEGAISSPPYAESMGKCRTRWH